MVTIQNTIKQFLKKYDLENPKIIYLIGFSGGYDSMCLLDALKKVAPKNKIIAIHINHKWRGEESDIEEDNCKKFCQQIEVDFYSENLPPTIAQTETAARDARYKIYEKCKHKFNSDVIFTAHNANDNAETLIYRICKGTGISGLQGINEHRGVFYRPLLSISRDEIERYCDKNGLNPNNDSSNSNTKYKRNYIRAEIIPKLYTVAPNAINMINSLSYVAREETQILDEYINIIINKISNNNEFKTKKFMQLSDPVQKKLIYNLFINNKLDYDRKKILKILDFIKINSNSKSGKTCSLTNNLWIYTSEKIIKIISNMQTPRTNLNITIEGKYKNSDYIFEIEKYNKPVKKYPLETDYTAYVDLSKLDFNFEIRTRQDGDIIRPFGMVGNQKFKKYLNSKKIPNHEKDNILLLTQNKEILWAIGLGISDKIKVNKNPTHIIKYYKRKNNNGY